MTTATQVVSTANAFTIECRHLTQANAVVRNWFPVWTSTDGAECAEYLRKLVETAPDASTHRAEYRMTFRR